MWNSEKLLNSPFHPQDFDREAPKSHLKEKNNYLIIIYIKINYINWSCLMCSLKFSTSEILKQHCQNSYGSIHQLSNATFESTALFGLASRPRRQSRCQWLLKLHWVLPAQPMPWNESHWHKVVGSKETKKQSLLLDFSLYGAQIVTFIWRIN